MPANNAVPHSVDDTSSDWSPNNVATVSEASGSANEPVVNLDAFRKTYARIGAAWQAQVLQKICQFLELTNGWDSYRGQPLKLETGMFALKILNGVMRTNTPAPAVVPTADGGVQFEWHENDFDLELYIAAPYDCELFYRDHRTNVSDAVPLRTNFSPLIKQIERLSGN